MVTLLFQHNEYSWGFRFFPFADVILLQKASFKNVMFFRFCVRNLWICASFVKIVNKKMKFVSQFNNRLCLVSAQPHLFFEMCRFFRFPTLVCCCTPAKKAPCQSGKGLLIPSRSCIGSHTCGCNCCEYHQKRRIKRYNLK